MIYLIAGLLAFIAFELYVINENISRIYKSIDPEDETDV